LKRHALESDEPDELDRRFQNFMNIGHQYAAAERQRISQGLPAAIDPKERPIPSHVHDALVHHGYDYVGRDLNDGMHHYIGNGHDVYYQSHPDSKNGSIWYHHSFGSSETEDYGDDNLKLHLDATHAKLEAYDAVWAVETPDGVKYFQDRQQANRVAADTGAPPPKMMERPRGAHPLDKKLDVEEARSEITHDSLASTYGFNEIQTTDAGKFGSVTRYFHPLGHNLIVTKRLKKGRERVQHTNDPGQWDHQWTFVNRDGQTTGGHTLRGLFDRFQTANLK
jgi:hypothetical protein